jgi:hypothetical protein
MAERHLHAPALQVRQKPVPVIYFATHRDNSDSVRTDASVYVFECAVGEKAFEMGGSAWKWRGMTCRALELEAAASGALQP